MADILFLGGPSGVGKSSFGRDHVANEGWVHIESDHILLPMVSMCRNSEGSGMNSYYDCFPGHCTRSYQLEFGAQI